MDFKVGQKVIYPNHGVGTIEKIEQKQIGSNSLDFYALRIAFNNSLVLVPLENVNEIGLRLLISRPDSETLLDLLSQDFPQVASDWKVRFRDFSEKLRTGDIFVIADVLKKLTYLHKLKPLSFREQQLLEKARYLVVSELSAVCRQKECQVEERISNALDCACAKHQNGETPKARSATVH